MAVKVSGLITPSSGSYIAEAKHIAFTDGTSAVTLQEKLAALITTVASLGGGSASDIIYEGTTTLKEKIDNLEAQLSNIGTSADKISYSYTSENGETVTTTVKVILDSLRDSLSGVSDISDNVAKAKEYSQAAANSASAAQAYQATITSTLNEKLSEITNINNSAQNSTQKVSEKLDSLESIAKQLAAVFDADASIEILSRSAYNALSTVDDTKLYFLYDDPTGVDTYYYLTLEADATKGTVVGTGSYAAGTKVVAVALPKSGGTFTQWSDGNTDNPRTITMEANTTLTATFE